MQASIDDANRGRTYKRLTCHVWSQLGLKSQDSVGRDANEPFVRDSWNAKSRAEKILALVVAGGKISEYGVARGQSKARYPVCQAPTSRQLSTVASHVSERSSSM